MKRIAIILLNCVLAIGLFNGCTKEEHNLYATIYGVVTDNDTSEPIAGASIVLSPSGKTQTSGTDGRFEFLNLDAAQYTVTVQKAGYQTNRKTVTAAAAEKTEANIPLTKTINP